MNAQSVLEQRLRASAVKELATQWGTLSLFATPVIVLNDQRSLQATLSLGLFLLGGWALVRTVRRIRAGKRTVIPQVASLDPRQVTWVHEAHGRGSSLQVHLLDGQTISLRVEREDCAVLLEFIRERAPHAIFGSGTDEQLEYRRREETSRLAI